MAKYTHPAVVVVRVAIRVLLFFLSAFLWQDCREPYLPVAIQTDYRYLVVSGSLIDSNGGSDSTIIRLSRTETLASPDHPPAELSAKVQIEEDGGMVYKLTNRGNGVYSLPPTDLNNGRPYRLRITAGNQEYASDFETLKQSPLLDSIIWHDNPDGIPFSVNAHDPENKTVYYMYTFEETWKYSSLFYSKLLFENGVLKYRRYTTDLYYCWRSANSGEIMVTSSAAVNADVINDYQIHFVPVNDIKLYFGYSLLVNQYALSQGAYDYWSETRTNNKKTGDLFGPLPVQAHSNIHCLTNPSEPVIGYFSASSITHKRVMISRQEINGPTGLYGPSGYEDCKEYYIPVDEFSESAIKGMLIIEDLFIDRTAIVRGYLVASEDCVDCRLHGGTLTMPGYWK